MKKSVTLTYNELVTRMNNWEIQEYFKSHGVPMTKDGAVDRSVKIIRSHYDPLNPDICITCEWDEPQQNERKNAWLYI